MHFLKMIGLRAKESELLMDKKFFSKISQAVGLSLILFFVSACAKKRPIDHVLPEVQRLEKSFFMEGQFYYAVTVVGTSADNPTTFLGDTNYGNSLATFEFTEDYLTAYAPDPRFKEKASLKKPILSFPVKSHVDIQRHKNDDDEETHIEEVTKVERPFRDRQYAEIHFSKADLVAPDLLFLSLYKQFNCIQEISSDLIDLSQNQESLHIIVRKGFEVVRSSRAECFGQASDIDSFSVDIKMSFLRKKENPKFKPTEMTDRHENHIGFFTTTVKEYGKFNEEKEKKYATHWDSNKEVVFTLSQNFPKKYKPIAQQVIDHWNTVFKDQKVLGKPLLRLKDNQGEELGDIRHNMIVWIEDPQENSLVGVGPSRHDPFTAEMINANVYIFSGNMRKGILSLLEKREEYLDRMETADERIIVENRSTQKVAQTESFDIKKDAKNSPYRIDKLLNDMRDEKTLSGALFVYRDLSGRCFYPSHADRPDVSWYLGNLSEEELFQKYLLDVLVHEIGHTLGLRHNFKGSLDKKHYISEQIKLSSAMDYPAWEDNTEGQPGPYDREALSFAYSGNLNFDEKYLFCTDDDVLSDPLCNRFDRGSSAKEIAEHLSQRYQETYERRNLRGKRLHFKKNREEIHDYIRSLLITYFLPMREFMDYFIYILDSSSKTQGITIKGELLQTEERNKLAIDLAEATEIGFNFFTNILSDERLPYKDVLYLQKGNDELLVRGTEIDKILSTLSLTVRDYNLKPWSHLSKATYFDIPAFPIGSGKTSPDYQQKMLIFYANLIKNPKTPMPIALLSAALMIDEIPYPKDAKIRFSHGLPSETILDLFRINKIELNDENRNKAIDAARTIVKREQMKESGVNIAEHLNPKRSEEIEYFIEPIEQMIYTTKRHPILFFYDETPAAHFVRNYHEVQEKLAALLAEYDQEFANPKLKELQLALDEKKTKYEKLYNIWGRTAFTKEQLSTEPDGILNNDLSDLNPKIKDKLNEFITPDEWKKIESADKNKRRDAFTNTITTRLQNLVDDGKTIEIEAEELKMKIFTESFGQEKQQQYYEMEKKLNLLKLRIDALYYFMQERTFSLGE